MRVPTPIVELHKADAAFAEPARQEAIVGEGILARLRTVQGAGLFSLARDIRRLGHAHLHAKGELVLRDACLRFRIAKLFTSLLVDRIDGVDGRSALIA